MSADPNKSDLGILGWFWIWVPLILLLHLVVLGGAFFAVGAYHSAASEVGDTAIERSGGAQNALWFTVGVFPEQEILPLVQEEALKEVAVERVNPLTGSDEKGEVELTAAAGVADGDEKAAALKEWYDQLIYRAFEEQWKEPKGGKSGATDLRVVITPEGGIDFYEISQKSGNLLLDQSVLQAASKVGQLSPLPDELGSAKYEVNIRFKLR